MSDLSLVINLGSSSLKAALVDSTGACPWHSGPLWLQMNSSKQC